MKYSPYSKFRAAEGGWTGMIRNKFPQQVRKRPSVSWNKNPSLGTTQVPFPSSAQKVQILILAAFSFSLCSLGSHMEASITYHKSPRQIPFYLKKAASKKGTESYIPTSKSWLYCTAEVIFSELFHFFEPHLLLLSYGKIKIPIDNHRCIN